MARRKQKQEQPVADDAVVKVAITAVVEADYEQRGVFPELRRRLTNWRPSSMSGGFWISVDLAVQVARDASAQHISYCEKKPDLSDALRTSGADERCVRHHLNGSNGLR